MRIGIFWRVCGLVICCVALITQSCRREPGKTPPRKQQQQPVTILDDMKEMLAPAFVPETGKWLVDDLLALVSTPERIASHRIAPKKDASGDHIAGYPLVRHGPDLTPEQRRRFQGLLLDQQSYRQESLKKCLFLPEYAFTFHKGDAALTLLFAASCAQIQFITDEKKVLRDCDPALPEFQQVLESVFPESPAASQASPAQTKDMQEISPFVAELLAGPALDAVAAPERVTAYHIFPKKKAADKNLHGYPVLKQSPELTPEDVAEFQALMLTDSSYRTGSVKKCLFLPEYAFVAAHGDTTVTLLCDVNCGQLKFLAGEHTFFTDWQNQGMANLHTLLMKVLALP